MATVAKVFKHQTDQCENLDNTTAGLAKDIEDWITANGGTVDGTSNLNVTCCTYGKKIFTLIVIDNNA